jgi:hypothetical protein
MIVVNFIIGLAIAASFVGILYGMGKLMIRLSQDFDEDDNPEFIEIILHGLLGFAVVAVCLVGLLLIYILGEYVVNKLY